MARTGSESTTVSAQLQSRSFARRCSSTTCSYMTPWASTAAPPTCPPSSPVGAGEAVPRTNISTDWWYGRATCCPWEDASWRIPSRLLSQKRSKPSLPKKFWSLSARKSIHPSTLAIAFQDLIFSIEVITIYSFHFQLSLFFSLNLAVQSTVCEDELVRLDEAYVQNKYKVN